MRLMFRAGPLGLAIPLGGIVMVVWIIATFSVYVMVFGTVLLAYLCFKALAKIVPFREPKDDDVAKEQARLGRIARAEPRILTFEQALRLERQFNER